MKTPLLSMYTLAGLLASGIAAAQPAPATQAAPLPFSELVHAGDAFYLSGQIGTLPGSDRLVPGGVGAQTRQAMTNIRALLATSGYTMDQLAKCTAYLTDMDAWDEFNAAYRGFFKGRFPARTTVGVTALALGAQVEIECMGTAGSGRASR